MQLSCAAINSAVPAVSWNAVPFNRWLWDRRWIEQSISLSRFFLTGKKRPKHQRITRRMFGRKKGGTLKDMAVNLPLLVVFYSCRQSYSLANFSQRCDSTRYAGHIINNGPRKSSTVGTKNVVTVGRFKRKRKWRRLWPSETRGRWATVTDALRGRWNRSIYPHNGWSKTDRNVGDDRIEFIDRKMLRESSQSAYAWTRARVHACVCVSYPIWHGTRPNPNASWPVLLRTWMALLFVILLSFSF